MLTVAKVLKDGGKKVTYINVGGGGTLVAEKYGVEAVDVAFNITQLLQALLELTGRGYDAVFIRCLDAFDKAFGREAFIRALRCVVRASRLEPAVVVSLRKLYGMDILFDVIIRVGEDFVESVRSPIGKQRISKAECV